MKTITSTLLLASCASCLANTFGVTGTEGYGTLDPQSIYHITSNGNTTKVANTANIVPNSLAFNPVTNVYYYGDHFGTDLYAYDVSSGSNVMVADLVNHGMPADYFLSGGADFYNGTYYYSPERQELTMGPDTVPQQANDIYAVNFSADGMSILSHTKLDITLPTGWSSIGDFGDIAIDTSTGILYGSSWAVNGTINDGAFFWSLNLSDPTQQIQVLGQTSLSNDNVYQVAYDAIEDAIFGNEWLTNEYLVINEADGTVVSSTPIAGNFYDLASSALPDVKVPEPSSTLLLGLASLGFTLRRKR